MIEDKDRCVCFGLVFLEYQRTEFTTKHLWVEVNTYLFIGQGLLNGLEE